MMSFIIRDAVLEDPEQILEVHTRSIREVCSADYTPEQISAWLDVLNVLDHEAAIETGNLWVAEFNGKIVGFSQFKAPKGWIKAVFVGPDFLGRGIGRKLVEPLERKARNLGLKSLRLNSTITAKPFYENAGYVAGPLTIHKLGNGGELPCYPMRKNLEK